MKMTEEGANRLLDVARALRDASRKGWSLEMGRYGKSQQFAEGSLAEYVTEQNCGTPACALGHYAVRRDLQKILHLDRDGAFVFAGLDVCASYTNRQLQEYFQLNEDESEELFSSWGCNRAQTALQAAKYIEAFVERKGFDIVEVPA